MAVQAPPSSARARSYEDEQWRLHTRRYPHRSLHLVWQDYFRDPLQWWDNRLSKSGPSYPDFRHKLTRESLRIDGRQNPSWVADELRRRGLLDTTLPHANHERITNCKEPLGVDDERFVALLRSCARNKDLCTGSRLHDDIVKLGLVEKCSDALVSMYSKCGAFAKAKELLYEVKSRNIYSWTALIAGYVREGRGQDALDSFEEMQLNGITPHAVTLACILKACGSVRAGAKGEQVHNYIATQGLLGHDIVLGTALVDMYAKCGALEKARQVLEELPSRNVVSWGALIAGYAKLGQGKEALNCLERMRQEGLSPDAVTFTCILNACGSIGAAEKGEQIHDEISKRKLLGSSIELGNALVDMYAKCGALTKARQVLEKLPVRDEISWNTLIAGYARNGQGEQALECFERMKHEALSPNVVTFTCILNACGSIGAADKGKQIHDEIERQGLLKKAVMLGTALVDMYAKCGALAQARQVLEELPLRDVISWNALITGCAQEGHTEGALKCFELMSHEGLFPTAVTFVCMLNAFGQKGFVEDGHLCFAIMTGLFGMNPNIDHYTSMVDLFGRAGQIDEALGMIQEMPLAGHSAIWLTLLGASHRCGDVNVGGWAFKRAAEGSKSDATAYLLMTNMYASSGLQARGVP